MSFISLLSSQPPRGPFRLSSGLLVTMKLYGILLLAALLGSLKAYNLPMSTGQFLASQKGDALTKAESMSDTRLGLTSTGLKGMLANSGQLKGAVDSESNTGEHARGMYVGNLHGKGGLLSSTNSQAGQGSLASQSALKGYVRDDGTLSGAVGTDAHFHGYVPYLRPYSMSYPQPDPIRRC
ncbi:uncharacterized protein LOC122261552 [Penaeus japonicus]|uniref:uncharacterized protein LOC122261552 n=1 Tax=Penaeus japonicus TaxID=27405 RepID=UPI001C71451E|nr:uncharacterized protein LOC122261552 [Penaeus japonicus]